MKLFAPAIVPGVFGAGQNVRILAATGSQEMEAAFLRLSQEVAA